MIKREIDKNWYRMNNNLLEVTCSTVVTQLLDLDFRLSELNDSELPDEEKKDESERINKMKLELQNILKNVSYNRFDILHVSFDIEKGD